jgi:hypothetical protein
MGTVEVIIKKENKRTIVFEDIKLYEFFFHDANSYVFYKIDHTSAVRVRDREKFSFSPHAEVRHVDVKIEVTVK